MHKIRSLLLSLPIALLVVAAAVPAYAHDGEDSNNSNSGSSSQTQQSHDDDSTDNSSDSNSGSGNNNDKKTAAKSEAEKHRQAENETKLRIQGKELLKEVKQDRKETKSKEQRQKVCEDRKVKMEERFTHITEAAQRHLSRINAVYTKAAAYKTTNNVTVANWDTLTATADAAKSTAADSVVSLLTVKPSVDCTSDTLPTNIATFKAAVTQARNDLKTYRQSVKAILSALETAKEGTTQQ